MKEKKKGIGKIIIRILQILIILIILIFILGYIIPIKRDLIQISKTELSSEYGEFLDIEDIKIYVEDLHSTDFQPEDNGKKTIIFIHGMGGSTYSWRENKMYIAQSGYRVIAIDLKGFGLSDKGFFSDYSHKEQARLISLVMDKKGIERAVMVGHSMGGSVVTHFAINHPERISRLILVDASIRENPPLFPGIFFHFHPIVRIGRHMTRYTINKDNFKDILISAYIKKDVVTDEVVDEYYNRFVMGDFDISFFAMSRDTNKNGIGDGLSDINVPTLIIWGENDPWISIEKGYRLNRMMINSQMEKINNTGHLPMEENPDVFNQILLGFLSN